MKRKFENSEDNSPSAKAIKQNVSDILLGLIKNVNKTELTLDLLKKTFPDLSIATCLELLKTLKDELTPKLTGKSKLVHILIGYLLGCNFKDIPESIPDFFTLLLYFHDYKLSPSFNGRLFNRWLEKLDWNNPLVVQQIPAILRCLASIASMLRRNTLDDYINLNNFNLGLSHFVDALPVNKNADNDVHMIFSVLQLSAFEKTFTGKLSMSAMEKLFLYYQQTNPEPKAVIRVTTSLINHLRPNERDEHLIRTDLLSTALLCLAQVDIQLTLKLFDDIVHNHYDQTKANTEPFQAESLQALIDCILHNDIKPALILNFVLSLEMLVKNYFTSGKVEHIEQLLLKIPLDMTTIFKELMAIRHLIPIMKTAITMNLIEKYLVLDVLFIDRRNISVLFSLIEFLEIKFCLSGQLQIDLFPFIDGIFHGNNFPIDERLLFNTASFLGTFLLKGLINNTNQPVLMASLPKLIAKLYSQLYKTNPIEKAMFNAFHGIKMIAQSGQFSGIFDTTWVHGLLKIMLDKHERMIKYSDLSNALYSLGTIGKLGQLKNFPLDTIITALNVFHSQMYPDVLFRVLTAVIHLTNSDALDKNFNYSYLSNKFQYLNALPIQFDQQADTDRKPYWSELIQDIPVLLQFAPALNAQLLVNLLPFMVDILQITPDKAAIDAIFDTCKQITQSNEVPAICPHAFSKLVDLFYRVNGQGPDQVLSINVIQYDLTPKKLLDDNSKQLGLLLKTLINIYPESFMSSNINRTRKDNILSYEINILSMLSEYLWNDIQHIPMQCLADIFDTIRIMVQEIMLQYKMDQQQIDQQIMDPEKKRQKLTKLLPRILLNTDQRWLPHENKYLKRENYLILVPEKYTFIEDIFGYLLSVSDLQTNQRLSILKGLLSLLQNGLIPGCPAEFLFAFFLKMDTEILSVICSKDLPCLIEKTKLSFKYPTNTLAHERIKHLISLAKNDKKQSLKPLCERVISTFMIEAARFGNIDDIKRILPLIHQTQEAEATIQAACKVASESASWPDVVQLLVKSPVFNDAVIQSIMVDSLQTFKHAHSAERIILLLFRLITYRGMDTDFVTTSLTWMETNIHTLVSPLNNMIHHARALEKHSLFACHTRQNQLARHDVENNTIDFEDAEKILRCLDI